MLNPLEIKRGKLKLICNKPSATKNLFGKRRLKWLGTVMVIAIQIFPQNGLILTSI